MQASYQQRLQNVKGLLSPLKYKAKSSVEIQIMQLLQQIHSLHPVVDNYYFQDGTQDQLFKLEGTIPIQYRSKQYNIPVALWLPLNFPEKCPICYVTPVGNMKIKQKHMHVDSQGLIYHPYLHNWKANDSTLVDLIGLFCSAFGKDPPLYASKQKTQSTVNRNALHHSASQPKPTVSPPMAHHSPAHQQQQQQHHPQSQPHSQYQQQHQPQHQPQPQPPSHPIQQPVAKPPEPDATDSRAKLEVKLKAALQKIYDKENQQLNSLAVAMRQLENHTKTVEDIRQRQSAEREQLLKRRQNLQIKADAMEQWLEANEKSEEIVVNDVVVASDIWSKQCIEATATEFAITDAMLELDRCLEDETIKLGTYLKQISKLAREQFASKALARAVYMKQSEAVQLHQRK